MPGSPSRQRFPVEASWRKLQYKKDSRTSSTQRTDAPIPGHRHAVCLIIIHCLSACSVFNNYSLSCESYDHHLTSSSSSSLFEKTPHHRWNRKDFCCSSLPHPSFLVEIHLQLCSNLSSSSSSNHADAAESGRGVKRNRSSAGGRRGLRSY
jgi:hypothetical protein